MDKQTPPPPPIQNAADYIDALTRPRRDVPMIEKKVIEGRRMRDKFRREAVLTEVVKIRP